MPVLNGKQNTEPESYPPVPTLKHIREGIPSLLVGYLLRNIKYVNSVATYI